MPHSVSQHLFYSGHLHVFLLAQSLHICVIWMWKGNDVCWIQLLPWPLHFCVKIQKKRQAHRGGTNKTHQKSLIESTASNVLSLARVRFKFNLVMVPAITSNRSSFVGLTEEAKEWAFWYSRSPQLATRIEKTKSLPQIPQPARPASPMIWVSMSPAAAAKPKAQGADCRCLSLIPLEDSQAWAELPYCKFVTLNASRPLELSQVNNAKIVGVFRCHKTRTGRHTLSKSLFSP